MSGRTPGQTVGPFFGYALPYPGGSELVPASHPDAVRLHGTVYDGAGIPVPDSLLELSQADAHGRLVAAPGSLHRDGWTFTGWGRAATDGAGGYSFTTVEPGSVDDGPAFFGLTVFARGLLDRLLTRIYLPGADDDAVLTAAGDRRSTLVATRDADGLLFDVHLQGEAETVFLRHG